MSYLAPTEFVTKMVDAGESKIFMSARDTLIRAFMAGALLTLAAAFAVKMTVDTGQPVVGAILFPIGFVLLYLLGYDLLTGVFVLGPLAWDGPPARLHPRRRAAQLGPGVPRQLRRRAVTAALVSVFFTYGFSTGPTRWARSSPHRRRPDPRLSHVGVAGWLPSSSAACCATGWSRPASSAR